jgi:hypothetical protein
MDTKTEPAIGQTWSDGLIERIIVAQVRGRDEWLVQSRLLNDAAIPVKDVVLPGWLFRDGRCGSAR